MITHKSVFYVGIKEPEDICIEIQDGNEEPVVNDIRRGLNEKGQKVVAAADELISTMRKTSRVMWWEHSLPEFETRVGRLYDDELEILLQIMYLAEKKGIIINYDTKSEILSFRINPDKYIARSGRKKSPIKYREECEGKSGSGYFTYADVLMMQNRMKDEDIMEITGMSRATYYRHKKEMLNSAYYAKLDKTRLSDEEYLNAQNYVPYF